MRLTRKKIVAAGAGSCQVYPKPKGSDVDSSSPAAAADCFLADGECSDCQAPGAIAWRYHPRPRSLPMPCTSATIPTDPCSRAQQGSCRVRDSSRCLSPPLHRPGLRGLTDSRAGSIKEDTARYPPRQRVPTATAPQTAPTASRRRSRRKIGQSAFLAAAVTFFSTAPPLQGNRPRENTHTVGR